MGAWTDWIRERTGTVLLVLPGVAAGMWWWNGRPVSQPPGVLAPADPMQAPPDRSEPWRFRDHTLTPLARFEIRARVLGAERYRFDRAAQLSPVDLALGWGPMSDTRVLDALTIRQGERWYFWHAAQLPVPPAEIASHSANMHMIPATEWVAHRLNRARPGQIVHLEGQLVRADGPDNWHWVSSLSRTDTGDGSCEVVWVERAEVSNR
ncbi:MAG TPA: hypothetical protein VF768_03995 [Holophagaceae bacterium]